jgi:hypothetical protein
MILMQTPWLQLNKEKLLAKTSGIFDYCYNGQYFACADIVWELWHIDEDEEIKFLVHDKKVPESYTVRLQMFSDPAFVLSIIGTSWALTGFYPECHGFLERFHKKHGDRVVWLECVGRKS